MSRCKNTVAVTTSYLATNGLCHKSCFVRFFHNLILDTSWPLLVTPRNRVWNFFESCNVWSRQKIHMTDSNVQFSFFSASDVRPSQRRLLQLKMSYYVGFFKKLKQSSRKDHARSVSPDLVPFGNFLSHFLFLTLSSGCFKKARRKYTILLYCVIIWPTSVREFWAKEIQLSSLPKTLSVSFIYSPLESFALSES